VPACRQAGKYSGEEKVRIILEGFWRKVSVAELCRKEGIQQDGFCKRNKDFMEAGRKVP
jgi:transposase